MSVAVHVSMFHVGEANRPSSARYMTSLASRNREQSRIIAVYGKSPGPAVRAADQPPNRPLRRRLRCAWLLRGAARLAGPESRYTASFKSLAGRNAIFLLAATSTDSPVAGLRTVRAGRSRTARNPTGPRMTESGKD